MILLYLSFRDKISELAANAGVVSTVQEAAQQCLQVSWVILMPRAEERAKALSGVDSTQFLPAAKRQGQVEL